MLEPMSPCLKCKLHSPTCHADCKDYDEYVRLHKEWVDAINKAKSSDNEMFCVEKQRFDKYRKWKHRITGK